jgi:hypothetical protein
MSSGSRLSFRAFLKPILHALGEFLRANSKKVGTDPPTFSRRIFSLINRIAKNLFFASHEQTRQVFTAFSTLP